MRARIIAVALLCIVASSARATCGTRGGPGFRDQNGHCVGWDALGRICGNPPTTHCTAELKSEGADDAANFGVKANEARNKRKKSPAHTGQSDEAQ